MSCSLKRLYPHLAAVVLLLAARPSKAALLAYEPFTNAPGTAIIGSGDGFGFSSAWQDYQSSQGVATNTGYGLSYTDGDGNTLTTAGGAGFFQGLTSANSSMQPIRLLNFTRGTNGTDGVTTWVSFIIVRQGPTGTLAGNPYGRGANLAHDVNTGNLQKIATGNSSNVATNTVGLIPVGASGNLKSSGVTFGNATNFVVMRIDHISGAANDNAFLFLNPRLNAEPSTNNADTSSLAGFDFSFDRIRAFAGGNANAAQPYAEIVADEYRVGETYTDVTPHDGGSNSNLPTALLITNTTVIDNNLVLTGTGGNSNGMFLLLCSTNINMPGAQWTVVSTNFFDANGNFNCSDPFTGDLQRFYRIRSGSNGPVSAIAPGISAQPQDQAIVVGQNALFSVTATGAALNYRWYFNTNTIVAAATNSSLVIANAQLTNVGKYSVIITNAGGTTGSVFATLTVTNLPGMPLITTQPANLTVTTGSNATFSIAANGDSPLAYQWYFNTNTPLLNATNASIALSSVQSSNAGGYSVRVTNNIGTVTSSVAKLTVNSLLLPGAYFVAPNGSDSNPGTLASPFKTISKGLTTISTSGTIYVRGGTYVLASKLSLSKTGTANFIKIWAYPGEQPIIDSTGNTSDGISISGDRYYFKGIEQKLAGHNGFAISGNSNILENCTVHDNSNTGVHITGSTDGVTYPAYNLITNCDSFLNFDPPIGGNADGFSAKWQVGTGNIFTGCRSYNNSDDGWDFWMATSTIIIENCWAFRNGSNVWASATFDGNGNGFKLGGNFVATPHITRNCVSFENIGGPTGSGRGYDENNNLAGQIIYNCTAYNNRGDGFHLQNTVTNGAHIVRNCIAYLDAANITSGTRDHNSWQGFSVGVDDFQNLDTSTATAARNPDGSLPDLPLLHLAPGSTLINAGTDVGLPFNGPAPDLGAFESP